MSRITALLEYLMLDLLFAGGLVFSAVEYLYIRTFESVQRMKRTPARLEEDSRRGSVSPDWENPQVVGRNRRRAHAPLHSFSSRLSAVVYNEKGQSITTRSELVSPNVMLLTGRCGSPTNTGWMFRLVGDPYQAPILWNTSTYTPSAPDWNPISLPGHWQLQGYDIPIYTNTTYPFPFDPPRARRTGAWNVTDCDKGLGASPVNSTPALHPKEPGENPSGLYRKTFTLPSHEWTRPGSKIFLVFEGVDSCLSVWVNDVFVGYSQDSCLPAEFDVTAALLNQSPQVGDTDLAQHTIACQVHRWCDGSYLEDQDKWWLSGIYREVYLMRKREVFIADYEFSADVVSSVILSSAAKLDEQDRALKEMELRLRRKLDGGAAGGGASSSDFTTPHGQVNPENPAEYEATAPTSLLTLSVAVEGLDAPSASPSASYYIRAELHVTETAPTTKDPKPVLVVVGQVVPSSSTAAAVAANNVIDPYCSDQSPDAAGGASRSLALLTATLPNPLLWSAEDPNLYTLVISLHASQKDADTDLQPLDIESTRVGLRDVRLLQPDNVIGINGRAITIAGVNRHEFDPSQGRSVSDVSMRADAVALKQLNFNAVRCSHYPNHPRWLELCDELGLYVVDEANLETHGFQALGQAVGYLPSSNDWRGAIASRIGRMYERDKNHPSVIFWSLGNESGYGRTLELMATWLRTRDPRRLVQYESGGARTACTDIICPMYQRLPWCKRATDTDPQRRPVVLCEYAHAMGNSGGCFLTYWKSFRDPTLPRLQGGFVWDLVDQGLDLGDDNTVIGIGIGNKNLGNPRRSRRFGYGGDFGDVPNTRNFCCNGLLSPDRKPHPSALEVKALQCPVGLSLRQFQPVGSEGSDGLARPTISLDNICLAIENHYSHSSLAGVEILVAFRCNASPAVELLHTPGGVSALPADPRIPLPLPSYPICRVRGSELSINPGGISGLPLLSLVPCLVPLMILEKEGQGRQKGWSEETSSGIAKALSLDAPSQLPLVNECWLEVSVVSAVATPALPLRHELIKVTFPEKALSDAVAKFVSDNMSQVKFEVLRLPKLVVSKIEPPEPLPCVSSPRGGSLGSTQKAAQVEEVITVKWSNGAYATVGVSCGRILTWRVPYLQTTCGINSPQQFHKLLAAPVDVDLWRAPTDNDKGGAFASYTAQWDAYGLGSLERVPGGGESACSIIACFVQNDGSVVIEAEWLLAPNRRAFDAKATEQLLTGSSPSPQPLPPPPLSCHIRCEAVYTFLPHGGINISATVRPPTFLPPLPRVGLSIVLPSSFRSVLWNGLGACEAYSDRRAAAHLGTFHAESWEALHTDYIQPQECGHRLAPRWILFSGGGGGGDGGGGGGGGDDASPPPPPPHSILIIPGSGSGGEGVSARRRRLSNGWGFSASHFSTQQLQRATHNHALQDENQLFVHVDSRHMGVGGFDSWSPNVEEAHLIDCALAPDGGWVTDILLLPCDGGEFRGEKKKMANEAYALFLRGDLSSNL